MLPRRHPLVMSIYLNSRGFAFALFEGPLAPCDWAVIEVRGKHKRDRIKMRVDALFARYRPDVLVLQDTSRGGTARPHHIRHINDEIAEMAAGYSIPLELVSRQQVRQRFAYLGQVTKDAVAAAITKHIPAFERFLPPPRKAWMSEHARMGIFDAAALALTFFSGSAASNLNAQNR